MKHGVWSKLRADNCYPTVTFNRYTVAMTNNAIYLTATELREISDALIDSASSEGARKLESLFADLSRRYPGESFKLKLILAL